MVDLDATVEVENAKDLFSKRLDYETKSIWCGIAAERSRTRETARGAMCEAFAGLWHGLPGYDKFAFVEAVNKDLGYRKPSGKLLRGAVTVQNVLSRFIGLSFEDMAIWCRAVARCTEYPECNEAYRPFNEAFGLLWDSLTDEGKDSFVREINTREKKKQRIWYF